MMLHKESHGQGANQGSLGISLVCVFYSSQKILSYFTTSYFKDMKWSKAQKKLLSCWALPYSPGFSHAHPFQSFLVYLMHLPCFVHWPCQASADALPINVFQRLSLPQGILSFDFCLPSLPTLLPHSQRWSDHSPSLVIKAYQSDSLSKGDTLINYVKS